MAAPAPLPLILFSGLAADAEVFLPQKLAFPQLIVPDWLVPDADETLTAYCRRLAEELRPLGPCVLGGASFGGIVAQEMARFMEPTVIVLIGSVRAPAELPLYAKACRPLRPLIPFLPVGLLKLLAIPATWRMVRRRAPRLCGLAMQFRRCDPRVFRWSLRRILDWDSVPEIPCPVVHIHGQRDFLLPAKGTHPDQIVAGGGHVVSLTHPTEVNAFLRTVLDRAAGGDLPPADGAHRP